MADIYCTYTSTIKTFQQFVEQRIIYCIATRNNRSVTFIY